MFPMPSMHSVPPSSRPSTLVTGTGMPSEANLSRLRSRLRQSGAIMSSRSVASRADAHVDFEVVDVGEGHHPTAVEQLLARLEQHGLRRRLAAEDDAAAYAVDVAVRTSEEGHCDGSPTSAGSEDGVREKSRATESNSAAVGTSSIGSVFASRHGDADAREPYYYLCVPCELRLTRISRRAPPWRALEDVHFHFSSAAHRSTAAWMADDDIDETLRCTPLIAPTNQYSRIFLNGVPTLLSRRPGGGDMFYPLPHEMEAARPPPRGRGVAHESALSSRASSLGAASSPFPLFPLASARGESGGAAVLWHRALPSVYTAKVQLLRRSSLAAPVKKPQLEEQHQRRQRQKVYRVPRRRARVQVYVDHVDLQTYSAHSRLPPLKIPLTPVVLPIHRARMAKMLLKLEVSPTAKTPVESEPHADAEAVPESIRVDDPHRTVYAQSYVPIAKGWRDFHKQGGGLHTVEAPMPLTVFEEESYRVALVSAEDQQSRLRRLPSLASRESMREEGAPVVLTRALLTQHTQTTSDTWQSPTGSDVGASMASSTQRASRSRQSSVSRSFPPPSRSQSAAPSRRDV
ncbi:hypothetical protein ABB37_04301 [Leptomonas pyrrhocoris]|uniref:Uncharacterized protein n=1 Tax=Leptomonas pyrrhocoris TaxID=157538 RepID=A0A0M9G2M7_LEPPY|nr:hypothetical protein ABB37_04301 [Leptomonas pyrrhocoris]KPA80896.1 hypothetical protein ABB37_04301 [Leptomonas pyrrhocoris]|eukprot:XP_015659335.1 hypothetical protein ABB37_04301 [Leptomonas pyrrhocoris]